MRSFVVHAGLVAGCLPLLAAQASEIDTESVVGPGLSISVGSEYAEGRYGEPDVSTTWTTWVNLRHERGPLTLKLYIPQVRTTGTAASGGDRDVFARQVQSGLGDVIGTAIVNAWSAADGETDLDLGVKVKFATADKTQDLLTTGKTDYSLQGELSRRFGQTSVSGLLGRTRKGDSDGVDFRDPWYTSLDLNRRLSRGTSIGLTYDYRQRLRPRGDPVSEATLYLSHRYSEQLKVQGYLVGGFSEASPDVAAGATVSLRF